MFANPFLVNATIKWVEDKTSTTASGKGLIGAFALVYLGTAVRMHAFSNRLSSPGL